jgi:hypothetical protein
VLDGDDRLAGVDEPVEQAEQLLDGGGMEAGGRLGEDVDATLVGGRRARLGPGGRHREHLCDGAAAKGVVEDSGLEALAAVFFAGGRDAGHHGRIDDRTAQRSSWMRTRLPAGSRKAQSRMPYGCSVGSWTTSASPACSFSAPGGVIRRWSARGVAVRRTARRGSRRAVV